MTSKKHLNIPRNKIDKSKQCLLVSAWAGIAFVHRRQYAIFFESVGQWTVSTSMYALMAIGYPVVVGVVGMVTFTHGQVIILAPLLHFICLTHSATICYWNYSSFCASWLIGMLAIKSAMNISSMHHSHFTYL